MVPQNTLKLGIGQISALCCQKVTKTTIWEHPRGVLLGLEHGTKHLSQPIGPMGLGFDHFLVSLSTFQKSNPPCRAILGPVLCGWDHFGTLISNVVALSVNSQHVRLCMPIVHPVYSGHAKSQVKRFTWCRSRPKTVTFLQQAGHSLVQHDPCPLRA